MQYWIVLHRPVTKTTSRRTVTAVTLDKVSARSGTVVYGLVTHTGTSSLTGLKPFHHFFLTTLIHRKSFVVTRHVFWAQNITYAFAYSVHEPPSYHSRLGRSSGRGGMKGERKWRWGAYQISSRYPRLRYNYFCFGRTNGHHIGNRNSFLSILTRSQ